MRKRKKMLRKLQQTVRPLFLCLTSVVFSTGLVFPCTSSATLISSGLTNNFQDWGGSFVFGTNNLPLPPGMQYDRNFYSQQQHARMLHGAAFAASSVGFDVSIIPETGLRVSTIDASIGTQIPDVLSVIGGAKAVGNFDYHGATPIPRAPSELQRYLLSLELFGEAAATGHVAAGDTLDVDVRLLSTAGGLSVIKQYSYSGPSDISIDIPKFTYPLPIQMYDSQIVTIDMNLEYSLKLTRVDTNTEDSWIKFTDPGLSVVQIPEPDAISLTVVGTITLLCWIPARRRWPKSH